MKQTEQVIQFGEGGFLRGFADWMLQKMTDVGAFDGSFFEAYQRHSSGRKRLSQTPVTFHALIENCRSDRGYRSPGRGASVLCCQRPFLPAGALRRKNRGGRSGVAAGGWENHLDDGI